MPLIAPARGSAIALALFATAAPAALAHDASTGGTGIPERPRIDRLSCLGSATCRPGDVLEVSGEGLDGVKTVNFMGAPGRRDDRRGRPLATAPHALKVLVPRGARTGRIRAINPHAGASRANARVEVGAPGRLPARALAGKVFLGGNPARFRYVASEPVQPDARVELYRVSDGAVVMSWPLEVDGTGAGEVRWDGLLGGQAAPIGRYGFRLVGAPSARAAQVAGVVGEFQLLDYMFPIRGRHDLGQSHTNNFGGGRGHQGQDMFARCGTPLVAARGGKVTKAGYQGRAGNYVVITDDTGQSHAYMHMRRPALVQQRQRVLTGQPLGEVGQTGRASGCHLHFELWTAPGWYMGGKPIDPLPELRRWDAFS